jgi:hypothetical protein
VLLALMVIAVWEEHEAAKGHRARGGKRARGRLLARPPPPRARRPPHPGARPLLRDRGGRGGVAPDGPGGRLQPRGVGADGRDAPRHAGARGRRRSDQVLFEHGLERIDALADARRERMVEAEEGIPAVLWAVLVLGGSSRWASPTCSGWRTRGRTG